MPRADRADPVRHNFSRKTTVCWRRVLLRQFVQLFSARIPFRPVLTAKGVVMVKIAGPGLGVRGIFPEYGR